jgi:hypothetical protein
MGIQRSLFPDAYEVQDVRYMEACRAAELRAFITPFWLRLRRAEVRT